MPAAPTLDNVLPEFYLLSFLEKRYSKKDTGGGTVVSLVRSGRGGAPALRIDNPAQPASSVGNGSMAASSSIALSSRAAKKKHDDIVRLRKVESKPPKSTLADKVFADLHRPHRKLYSRGHCVPNPTSPAPLHPPGAAPVVLRNHEMGSSGRNVGTARPQTATEQEYPSSRKTRAASPGGGGGGGEQTITG